MQELREKIAALIVNPWVKQDIETCRRYCADWSHNLDIADAILALLPKPEPEAAREVPTLDIILEWFRTLPKPARERISLERLHTLSKVLQSAIHRLPSSQDTKGEG